MTEPLRYRTLVTYCCWWMSNIAAIIASCRVGLVSAVVRVPVKQQGVKISLGIKWLLASLLLLSLSLPVLAQNKVLVIHSYESENGWTVWSKIGFHELFKDDINTFISHEHLDSRRYPSPESRLVFFRYLKEKYAKQSFDVIVTSDDPALQFARTYRETLFPSVPIVYMGIDQIRDDILQQPNMTGIFENRDFTSAIIDISKISGSDSVVVIANNSALGRSYQQRIRAIASSGASGIKIHLVPTVNNRDIGERLAHFSEKVPIFLLGKVHSKEHNNALLSIEDSLAALMAEVDNPIYALSYKALHHGAVGANSFGAQQHGREAAALVKRLLLGERASHIAPITDAKTQWEFNWQMLQAFGIDEHRLPVRSHVINRDKTLYQQYKRIIWGVCGALVLALIIIGMLVEIIRRGNKTRHILSENELRYRDLAHAGASIFWETDNKGACSYISGDTQELVGRPSDQVIGQTFVQLCRFVPHISVPWYEYESAIAKREALKNLLLKIKRTDADLTIWQINGKPIYDKSGQFIGYRGICKQVTEEYALSKKLAYQAAYDPLTGLKNRASFNEALREYVQQHQGRELGFLCFLDLDRFKLVNDTAGHLVGDAMLAEVAGVIDQSVSSQDLLGRLGGDEFGLLLHGKSLEEATKICASIIASVKGYKYRWNQRYFSVGVSIGMVPIAREFNEIELLSKADLSCYKAKDQGRGRVYVSDLDSADLYHDELEMGYIANVAHAIEQNQFYLCKQLIKPFLGSGLAQKHYELLIRFRDEKGNVVQPNLFIPAAEKHNVITLIDQWVLRTALEQYDQFFPDKNTVISINLSAISISDESFVKNTVALVQRSGVDPHNICFEITETAAISQFSQALHFVHELRSLGVRFALDDFGSGASFFGYLKELPIDYLKIDGSLVKHIVDSPTDRAILESICAIAKIMEMKTIAEYVENDAIEAVLRELGVDYGQGYGIHMPELC